MPHSAAALPKNWPASVEYLTAPRYASGLDVEIIRQDADGHDGLHSPSPYALPPSSGAVRIVLISDAAHPANGQRGLFAARHLPPEAFVVQYLGCCHAAGQTDPLSDYDLALDRDAGIAVDASRAGNEARFINDYRGISPHGPNAEFRDVWVAVGGGKVERRIAVFVLSAGKSGKRSKGIAKGQEILVSYGKGFWAARD